MGKDFSNEVLEKIWKDRYCKNNETLDENYKRVAKYCATNDTEEKDFYEVMKDRLFFPAGRTMSNSGIGKNLTLNNCFTKGTKIITKRGLVNIEDIIVGDEVITHDDTWQKVNEVMCRDYIGDLYKITSCNAYNDTVCTPNHNFLTQNGWKRADRILYGGKQIQMPDRIKVAKPIFTKTYNVIDITSNFISSDTKRINIEENKVQCEVYCKNKINTFWQKRGYPVNKYLVLDTDMRYFIGRWIGDGSITGYRGQKNPSIIQIVFNATTEKDAAEKCIKIGTEKFGHEPSIQITNQNIISIRWCNEVLGSWFKSEFGEKCNGKHLDDKYLGDFEIARGLLDSDGVINVHGGVRIALKNYQLIKWLKDTLYLNGINTQQIKKEKYDETYSISVSTYIGKGRLNQYLSKTYYDSRNNKSEIRDIFANYIGIENIEVIENQSCKVYNLSVENSHSYTVNGMLVHNCFVAPQIKDDLTDIFDKVKLGAITHQKGGGIGYDFSQLRPKGTPTSNDAIASGAISFMDCFNSQTATILQGNRRGANMGVMNIYDMDIEDFINAKSYDECKLNHFNISVMVDDDFINAVKKNEDVYLHFPVYNDNGKIVKDENEWKLKKKISAKYLWDLIIKKAYDNGEPGIFFYDNLNKDNNLWYIENIICSNPLAN